MSQRETQQILLPLGLKKQYTFDTYFSEAQANPATLLYTSIFERKEPVCFLLGPSESGKTHLCAALVAAAQSEGVDAQYLSLKELLDNFDEVTAVGYIQDIKQGTLIVLDDIDYVAGHESLELALFNLYNDCIAESKQLVLSSRSAVSDLNIRLADLVSRLQFALTVRLKPISEEGKKLLIMRLAQERGIKMSYELAEYIALRSARNMKALVDVIERLDHASLLEKRSLTIPFTKKVMGW